MKSTPRVAIQLVLISLITALMYAPTTAVVRSEATEEAQHGPGQSVATDANTADQHSNSHEFVKAKRPATEGPLHVHPDNPRYFTDDSGRAILLTGSHTWNNLVEMNSSESPKPFDYDRHLEWLEQHNHNFFRLWAWEILTWDTRGNKEQNPQILQVAPHPWKRTGPGNAADGKLKFDLQQLNDDYFARLRTHVETAQDRGFYPAVMLFEGWGIRFSVDGWKHHPFHPDNNINGLDGDVNGDGNPSEVHDGSDQRIVKLQQNYVSRVIDTVNRFDNVLYEISNENHGDSTDWQYSMIRFIKEYERTKTKQHPVGMTFQHKGGDNQLLLASPADWISPNKEGGYRDDPPAADGSKVIVTDTDHLWGIGGNEAWVWKSFFRGLNPIFMDPVEGSVLKGKIDPMRAEAIRRSMGQALDWSRRIDLAAMPPHEELCSTKYCLADAGNEYLAYVPKGVETVWLDLPNNKYTAVWFNTSTGREVRGEPFRHTAGKYSIQSPFNTAALLYVQSSK